MRTTTARVATALLAAGVLAAPLRAQEAPASSSQGQPAPASEPRQDQRQAPAPAATPAAEATSPPAADPATGSVADPAPAPAPAAKQARPSIFASIDRSVAAVVRGHQDPCAKADNEGKPCFPVLVEEDGPTFSVRDGLRHYQPDLRPAPGVPTTAEIQRQMTGAPRSASGGAGGDPVCGAKALIRLVKGRPNTFYLYRLTKDGFERPLLTDHKVDLLSYAAAPGAQLEFIGEFHGECQAIAAWRKAMRKAREGPPEPEDHAPGGQSTTP